MDQFRYHITTGKAVHQLSISCRLGDTKNSLRENKYYKTLLKNHLSCCEKYDVIKIAVEINKNKTNRCTSQTSLFTALS